MRTRRAAATASVLTYLPILAGLTCTCAASRADSVLDVKLPAIHSGSQPASAAARAAQARAFLAESNRLAARHTAARGSRLASRGAQAASDAHIRAQEHDVGRLGVAQHELSIRATPGSRRVLSRISSGTYLALTGEDGDWYGVLMADHSTGWVRKEGVELLNYKVVSSGDPGLTSRGGYAPGSLDGVVTGAAHTILNFAYGYLGVPYHYGGTSLSDGIDCSAFVQKCFATVGQSLPRTAHEQALVGEPVSPDQLQPGDRLYFADREGHITHTGIYISGGNFIHASSRNHGISISNLSDPLYRRMFAGARRSVE